MMTKESAELIRTLNHDPDAFKQKFAAIGTDYLRTKIREESIIEKILDVKQVDENHEQMQKDVSSDTMYYLEDVEIDALAMEVGMRADSIPRFVNGKRYQIRPGKIESEEVKKTKMELRVADNLVNFIKTNNVDAVRRVQDMVGFRTIRAGLSFTGTTMGLNAGDFAVYDENSIDWTSAARKKDLVDCATQIVLKELKPARWVMSEAAYSVFAAMDAGEIGDMAGPMLTDGFDGNLMKLPVVRTIKSGLRDVINGNHFFDYTDPATGAVYSDIYLFVDYDFLGRIIKIGDDEMWSKWEKDVFFWQTWRYVGLGFGDVRGIAMMRVQLSGPRNEE